MAQIRQDDRFSAKLPCVFFRREKIIFNCNLDAQILVHGPIDRTHAPLPKNLNDPVTVIE